MLKSIDIKNFALINSVHLNFKSGLNIIIGETGAGKSIIVDALLQTLGDRASSELVRTGTAKSIIEADFELPQSHPAIQFLSENDIEITDGNIIARREISSKGTSRCFINDNQVQVSTLHEFGELLADFHGQHDHQILLKVDNHISILDDFAGNDDLRNSFSQNYDLLIGLIDQHKILLKNKKDSTEKINSYMLELKELQRINPLPEEDVLVQNELIKIENSETLFNLTDELDNILEKSDSNIHSNLIQTRKLLENLSKFDASFEQYAEETKTSIISINEIINFVSNYRSTINFDQQRIEELRERIILLKGLTRKYGSLELAINRIDFLKEQLEIIERFDEKVKTSEKQIISQKTELGKWGFLLSEKRKQSSVKLEKGIIAQLNNLGLENSIFKVVFDKKELVDPDVQQISVIIDGKEFFATKLGIDYVQFFISTNKGEEPKPLVNVASGGEISRLMLAIKSVISDSEKTPILVFDEIDTGISGRIAGKVGLAMKELSKLHQIIVITHLAQIAVQGVHIISVIKKDDGESTEITTREEDEQTKIHEIAKLLSADNVTETSIKNVHELLRINYHD